MKLTTDFSELWKSVRQMGKFEATFDFHTDVSPDFELDRDLSSIAGLDITLDDLNIDSGVLSVKGRQVLLFIPDQGSAIEDVLAGKADGRRFHVADCSTLESMRKNNRFNRYKATYNTGGVFHVYGVSPETRQHIEGDAQLKVCKNCLKYLNYQGYRHASRGERNEIFNRFSIAEFLSSYSTLFRSMPDRSFVVDKGGYSDDWEDISLKYRQSVGFRCEQCGVDLSEDRSLLHVHHISGNKRENHRANLKALCVDCHRKQPHHEYMRVTHGAMVRINKLRREQGLLSTSSWQQVRNLADKALDGLIRFYEQAGLPVPEVGYEISGPDQSVVAELEVAWPSMRRGIAISEEDIKVARRQGWDVVSVGEALKQINSQ